MLPGEQSFYLHRRYTEMQCLNITWNIFRGSNHHVSCMLGIPQTRRKRWKIWESEDGENGEKRRSGKVAKGGRIIVRVLHALLRGYRRPWLSVQQADCCSCQCWIKVGATDAPKRNDYLMKELQTKRTSAQGIQFRRIWSWSTVFRLKWKKRLKAYDHI